MFILVYFQTPSARPDPKWPQQGEIIYDNVSMSYKVGGHKVLSNLTLMVKPRQKVRSEIICKSKIY